MNKFFLALTAGIAIGILIAPAKGSETRKKIKDAVDELKDEIFNKRAEELSVQQFAGLTFRMNQ